MAVLSNIGFKRPTYAEILDAQIARAKTLFGDDIETSELTIPGQVYSFKCVRYSKTL